MRPPLAVRFMPLRLVRLASCPRRSSPWRQPWAWDFTVRGPLDLPVVLHRCGARRRPGDGHGGRPSGFCRHPGDGHAAASPRALSSPRRWSCRSFASAVRPFTAALSIAARMGRSRSRLRSRETVLALGSTFPVAIALGLALARSTVPIVPFTPFLRRRTDPVETRQSHQQRSSF